MEGVYPSIIAIGDSWFWYPFPGGSLINQLGALVEKREHIILTLGHNGAEAAEYRKGKFNKNVRFTLKMHGESLSAVFISGGGNDFAGVDDLGEMLKPDCAKLAAARDCFLAGSAPGTLDAVMDILAGSYRMLVDQVQAAGVPTPISSCITMTTPCQPAWGRSENQPHG